MAVPLHSYDQTQWCFKSRWCTMLFIPKIFPKRQTKCVFAVNQVSVGQKAQQHNAPRPVTYSFASLIYRNVKNPLHKNLRGFEKCIPQVLSQEKTPAPEAKAAVTINAGVVSEFAPTTRWWCFCNVNPQPQRQESHTMVPAWLHPIKNSNYFVITLLTTTFVLAPCT